MVKVRPRKKGNREEGGKKIGYLFEMTLVSKERFFVYRETNQVITTLNDPFQRNGLTHVFTYSLTHLFIYLFVLWIIERFFRPVR